MHVCTYNENFAYNFKGFADFLKFFCGSLKSLAQKIRFHNRFLE